MERKAVSGMMLTLLLIGMLTLAFNVQLVKAEPGTITVPDDYPTIQEAINAANLGDTIIVSVGLYAEGQINVNKSLTLLADGALVDGLKKGHVFYVTASHVTIEGFTVKKSKTSIIPSYGSAGIRLRNVQNCTVSGNIIKETGYGVWLSLSNNNTVDGNTISSASSVVYLSESGNNQVTNNTLTSVDGISLSKSNNNIISDNTISRSTGANYGISLSKSTNNTITTNTIRLCIYGVSLSSGNRFINNKVYECMEAVNVGSNNTITSNKYWTPPYGLANIVSVIGSNNTITANAFGWVKLTGLNNKFRDNNMTNFEVATTKLYFINDVDASNTLDGKPIYYWINKHNMTVPTDAGYVALFNCTGITVQNIAWSGNSQGIILVGTSNSTIKNNNINSNGANIRLYVSSHNAIYHNKFTSRKHVSSEGSTNIWDNGYPSGGNYWSGYEEADEYSGSDQDQPGSDGIGDYPKLIDMFNRDRFPLLRPIKFFDAGVGIVSNSAVSNFQLNAPVKTISFNVAGSGFCRVTIPNIIVQDLWQGNYTVLVDGEPPLDIRNWTTTENTYIYFTYQSEHEVIIVPEFPSAIIMPLFMIISMLAVALAKRKSKKLK